MTAIGFNQPLYVLPFDHRGSFQTKMFGWPGTLTSAQTAEVAAKQVIDDGFKAALKAGVPERKAGVLVDEQFGTAILRDATAHRPGFFPRRVCRGLLDSFLVHWEGNNNLHRTVERIKALGKRAGVAINPATPAQFWKKFSQISTRCWS